MFKVEPVGKETVLHTFGGLDGSYPYGGLIFFAGNLYGTTSNGGPSNRGVVFRLGP
jgi:uncharacterized repeat protein (TIGR03803 family)